MARSLRAPPLRHDYEVTLTAGRGHQARNILRAILAIRVHDQDGVRIRILRRHSKPDRDGALMPDIDGQMHNLHGLEGSIRALGLQDFWHWLGRAIVDRQDRHRAIQIVGGEIDVAQEH
jgi:hypothetical protein